MHPYPFKILDPIHGFIRFDALEQRLIHTLFFQRLRYIRQMGVTYLIYPGANHTRFEHSLGVMELASRIFDTLLLEQHQIVQIHLSKEELIYWKKIIRLAALCHDMGHLPFSHTAEQSVLGPKGHEKMLYKILYSGKLHFIEDALGADALTHISKLAIDSEVLKELAPTLSLTPIEELFAKIITEDNFGADRIDYLIRDAKYTGVGYGHFDYHQLIDTLRILPDGENFALGIIASGIQSVESLWIARYLMYARVYKHPKSCLYSAHMERYMNSLLFSLELEAYQGQTDYKILEGMGSSASVDARIVLQQAEPYKIVPLTEKKQQLLLEHEEEIKKIFNTDLMIEKSKKNRYSRNFIIYEDAHTLLSSEEYSEFLNKIPLGIKSAQLFVHPRSLESVQSYLQKRES